LRATPRKSAPSYEYEKISKNASNKIQWLNKSINEEKKEKVKNKKFYYGKVYSSARHFGHALSSVIIENVSPHSLHLKKVLSPTKLLSHS
jgi:hypothetical protein